MAEHDTPTLKFPEWQQHCLAALTEVDRKKLTDRVTDAENAIFRRRQSIAQDGNHHAERKAMEDALSALRVLKREQLDFPDWE